MSAQRLDALERANAIRLGRASLRRSLKNKDRTFASVLEEVPDCCANAPAFELLMWCPRVGYTRAKQLTRRADRSQIISETIPLCKLGPFTRAELLERLQQGGVL